MNGLLDNKLMQGLLGLGEFAVDTVASGISDPYKQNLMALQGFEREDARLQQNRQYVNQALGNTQQMQGLDPMTQALVSQEGGNPNQQFVQQQGNGYMGSQQGPNDKMDFLGQMINAPLPGTRLAANAMMRDQLHPIAEGGAQSPYFKTWEGADGAVYGLSKATNQVEKVEGAAIPQKQQSALVNNYVGGTMKPEPGTHIVNGRQVAIPGSSKDVTSDLYREGRSKLYRKDIKPLRSALASVTNFQSILKETGIAPTEFSAVGKRLKQAQTSALMDLKNVYNLGVLSKDDERLINNILPSGASVIDYALHSSATISALIERSRQEILRRGLEVRTEYPNANYGDDIFKPVEKNTDDNVIDWNDL